MGIDVKSAHSHSYENLRNYFLRDSRVKNSFYLRLSSSEAAPLCSIEL